MSLAETLSELLPPGTELAFGELALSRSASGVFRARHTQDRDAGALQPIETVRELRELAKNDAAGEYRPLKTAPGLVGGWTTETDCPREFLKRLDAIYPGVFAAACAHAEGRADAVALRATLDRQTGMYRFAGTISDEDARRVVSEVCAAGCLRHVVWPIGVDEAPSPPPRDPGSIPLICLEACTFAVNKARELAKEAFERSQAQAQA